MKPPNTGNSCCSTQLVFRWMASAFEDVHISAGCLFPCSSFTFSAQPQCVTQTESKCAAGRNYCSLGQCSSTTITYGRVWGYRSAGHLARAITWEKDHPHLDARVTLPFATGSPGSGGELAAGLQCWYITSGDALLI